MIEIPELQQAATKLTERAEALSGNLPDTERRIWIRTFYKLLESEMIEVGPRLLEAS